MGFGSLGLVGNTSSAGAPWAVTSDVGVYLDFLNNRGFNGNSAIAAAISFVTVSRAQTTTSYVANSSGVYLPFAANLPRWSNLGLLQEEARTNVVLWCRDLTNAAWTKTTVTAALDQTGIDGVSNSASSILATAGNGTVLQAITLGSTARWQSAFVKRITGTGTINMTMDNGSTWTAVTVTSAWTRVSIPTQTLANPTVGFQIVTNGDKIAVDFVQNEAGSLWATSPILTTTASVTRNADLITLTTLPAFGAATSLYARGTPQAPTTYGNDQAIIQVDDGTANNRAVMYKAATTAIPKSFVASGGSSQYNQGVGASAWTGSGKLALAFTAGTQRMAFGGTLATAGSGALQPVGLTTVRLGADTSSTGYWNGFIEQIGIWPALAISDATKTSITT